MLYRYALNTETHAHPLELITSLTPKQQCGSEARDCTFSRDVLPPTATLQFNDPSLFWFTNIQNSYDTGGFVHKPHYLLVHLTTLTQLHKLCSVENREIINYKLGRTWKKVTVWYVKKGRNLSIYLREFKKKERKISDEHKQWSQYTIEIITPVSSYYRDLFYIFVCTYRASVYMKHLSTHSKYFLVYRHPS